MAETNCARKDQREKAVGRREERWGEGLSAQFMEGVAEGKPSPKTVDYQIPPLSKSLRFSYLTRHEKLRLIFLRTL